MNNIKELVAELNKSLNAEGITEKEVVALINIAKDNFHVKIKMLDFAYYDESKQLKAKKDKINALKSEKWETLIEQRSLELECGKYIKLRKQFNITASSFYYEDNDLYYLCLGNACNDNMFRKLLICYRLS